MQESGKWEARKLQRSDIFVEKKLRGNNSSAGKAKQGTKLISDEMNGCQHTVNPASKVKLLKMRLSQKSKCLRIESSRIHFGI